MTNRDLTSTARALVANGKGILAADETVRTISHRLDALGIPSTFHSRAAFRELFFTTPGISEFISGVIMHEETIRQQSASGVPFSELLSEQAILPGIKVDNGAQSFAGAPGQFVTEGLDALRGRLTAFRKLGARFAKWRALIALSGTTPTGACVLANAHALARFAALCQEQDIVPVIEPEVLMDGDHTIERSENVTASVLHAVFNALHHQNVLLEGVLLKPNMVLSGTGCIVQAPAEDVAAATLRTVYRHVPAAVPGVVFLSGAQSPLAATLQLNLINQLSGPKPWALSYSYGRALQDEAMAAWRGRNENVRDAQSAFHHRARCDSAATLGQYSPSMETESVVA
jgi:fructose-bisphosphate aldolase, class I